MKRYVLMLSALLFVANFSFAQDAAKIEKGKVVKFDYTLNVDGEMVETTTGKEPLEYTQGAGLLIPGLESQLEGMKVGEEKAVTVEPKDGYGEVNPEATREFPASAFPEDFKPEVGMVIEIKDKESGEAVPGVISDMKDGKVTVNFNHPLAGKTLVFNVKIVEIK